MESWFLLIFLIWKKRYQIHMETGHLKKSCLRIYLFVPTRPRWKFNFQIYSNPPMNPCHVNNVVISILIENSKFYFNYLFHIRAFVSQQLYLWDQEISWIFQSVWIFIQTLKYPWSMDFMQYAMHFFFRVTLKAFISIQMTAWTIQN